VIVEIVKKEIAKHDKRKNRLNCQRFFKEKLADPIVLKTEILRKISNELFEQIKDQPKQQIFDHCEQLLASGMKYGTFFAFEWAGKIDRHYTKTDFTRFAGWLEKYVYNWGACDHLCCGPLGHLLLRFPGLSAKTIKWAKSKNLWQRRAAAVCLIVPIRRRLLLDEVFGTADLLLTDREDLVQKGYGWMLKVAGKQFPEEVFAYVMRHKRDMPRTAFRYAIEKLPPDKRKTAMIK